MANKIIKTRIQIKHDTSANWKLATNFKPLEGEMILYTDTKQIKVGDGETLVNALPFYPSGDVTAAGNNTFTGTNIFKDNPIQIEKTSPNPGPNYPGIYITNERLLVSGGDTVSSQVIITAEEVGITTPFGYCSLEKNGIIKNGSSSDETFSLTLPKKNGTLATTDDSGDTTYRGTAITDTSTTATVFSNSGIENAKVGDWYINTANGNVYQCTVVGNATTAKWVYKNTQAILSSAAHMGVGVWGDDTTPEGGYGAFLTYDENTLGGYLDLINVASHSARVSADSISDNRTYDLPDKSGTFALTDDIPQANPTDTGTEALTKLKIGEKIYNVGDVTAAGDNTFTGSNIFKKAVTLYTDAANGNSMSATLDSYKLKLFNDLGGVYADLNITSDTAPYLELKTVGHGKVKYTSESIIFTDTQGNSKTTTLKFPGQGATADSTKTLATLEGNQIFTRAITTTDGSGFIIAPTNTNNYTASIWIDSASLTENQGNIDLEIYRGGIIATEEWTTAQLQGLFTYANNTLTINI